jgi:hypothetical protein
VAKENVRSSSSLKTGNKRSSGAVAMDFSLLDLKPLGLSTPPSTFFENPHCNDKFFRKHY